MRVKCEVMNITFIGGGNMATALIGGLISGGADARDFRVVEPVARAAGQAGRRVSGHRHLRRGIRGAVDGADLVVLAVKPQQCARPRRRSRRTSPTCRSCCRSPPASASPTSPRWLGGYPRLVRAMPNTPALIGEGISGAFALPEADARGRKLAQRVLEAAGKVLWVDREEMLDAVTGVSGSGPAYVFYFLEGARTGGARTGLLQADARTLAYATFAGAIALAAGSALEPAMLRAQVTSKGGTTERAIAMLEADNGRSPLRGRSEGAPRCARTSWATRWAPRGKARWP